MNVLVVEDEKHTANLLEEIIIQDTGFTVVEKLESVAETVQFLSEKQSSVDLIFLDIQLADGHSFEIFKHIDVSVPVVFCMAYEEYSFNAIKNNGIDYVLKPFREDEIRASLEKYKRFAHTFQAKLHPSIDIRPFVAENNYQQNFLTHYRQRTLVIPAEEAGLFSIEFETVYLYTFKGNKYPVFKKMEYIESVCDPALFFRINRQMIVSRNAVKAIEPYENRKAVLQLVFDFPQKVIVSKLKVTAFKRWVEGL